MVFHEKYDFLTSWPDLVVANEHEAEGRCLYEEMKGAWPNSSITSNAAAVVRRGLDQFKRRSARLRVVIDEQQAEAE